MRYLGVADKIMCMHGGLSPDLEDLSQIMDIQRPTDVPDEGLLCDLLWSDPDMFCRGWAHSMRGVSYAFGHDIISEFLSQHGFDLICRAHQVVEDGYEFQADRQLVTIFSAPNYCGEFNNAGAMMVITSDLVCSFKILRPLSQQTLSQKLSAAANRSPTPKSSNTYDDENFDES